MSMFFEGLDISHLQTILYMHMYIKKISCLSVCLIIIDTETTQPIGVNICMCVLLGPVKDMDMRPGLLMIFSGVQESGVWLRRMNHKLYD